MWTVRVWESTNKTTRIICFLREERDNTRAGPGEAQLLPQLPRFGLYNIQCHRPRAWMDAGYHYSAWVYKWDQVKRGCEVHRLQLLWRCLLRQGSLCSPPPAWPSPEWCSNDDDEEEGGGSRSGEIELSTVERMLNWKTGLITKFHFWYSMSASRRGCLTGAVAARPPAMSH